MKEALKRYQAELESIREAGTYKEERIITPETEARLQEGIETCIDKYLKEIGATDVITPDVLDADGDEAPTA